MNEFYDAKEDARQLHARHNRDGESPGRGRQPSYYKKRTAASHRSRGRYRLNEDDHFFIAQMEAEEA